MVVCALASAVTAGAFNPSLSYGRTALVGAAVGLVLGIADFYLVRLLVYALASPLPDRLDHLMNVAVSVIFVAAAAALSATAASSIVARSGSTPRSVPAPAIVGGGFGLVASIANGAIGMIVPAIGLSPTGGLSAIAMIYIMIAAGLILASIILASIIVDGTLAFIAFRFVRRRWGAAAPATATGTC